MEGQHGDIKYPGKERRGVSVNIGGLGGLCLLVSIFSSTRVYHNPVNFCLGDRDAM